MRYILIISLVLIYPLNAELTLKKINEMVKKIQGKREGKIHIDFEKVPSPFAVVVHDENNATSFIKKVEVQIDLRLSAIINDKARINNRWVAPGDIIEGYHVDTVDENRVLLSKGKRRVDLFLPKQREKQLFQIK